MSTPAVISIREQGALELIRALLQQGVTVRMKVSGVSMLPFLRGGDLVEISPLHEKKLKKGDIILFCDQQGNPLVHRLHRRRYSSKILYLQTKGDACAGYDPPVPINQVVGRIQRIITDRKKSNLQCPISCLRSRFLVYQMSMLFFLRRIKVIVKKGVLDGLLFLLYR